MLAEMKKIVPIISDGDLNGAAVLSGDSINMKNYSAATFIVNLQTLGGAATYIKLHSGATDAALTSALTFLYAFGGAATESALADVLEAWSSSANLLVAHATYDNFMLVIHVDASAMDLANAENWLTINFNDTDTGSTGNVSVVAVLEPRYSGNRSATALT